MSTELDKQLADLVSSAKSAGQDAYAFIQQQAPDICQQFVQWQITEGYFKLGGGILLLSCAMAGIVFGYVKRRDWDEFGYQSLVALAIVCSIFGVGLSVAGGMQITKAQTAPKVVLMEAIAKHIR